MELAIQVTSLSDPMFNKIGFKYELNCMDGNKILDQKTLIEKNGIHSGKLDANGKEFLNNSFKEFVSQVEEEYPNEQIKVFYNKKCSLENISELCNNLNVVDLTEVVNQQKTGTLLKNMMMSKSTTSKNENNTNSFSQDILKKNKKNKKDKNRKFAIELNKDNKKQRKPNSINKKDESFVSKKSTFEQYENKIEENKNKNEMLFKQNVIGNKKLKEIVFDVGFFVDNDSKRFGLFCNTYSTKKGILSGNYCLHKDIKLCHGDESIAFKKTKEFIFDRINTIMKENPDKKIVLNFPVKGKPALQEFERELNKFECKDNIEWTTMRSKLLNSRKKMVDDMINTDLSIYLKELKNPNNIVLYTDGSVNKNNTASGSGTIFQYNNTKKEIGTTNSEPNSLYAELKAVYNGLNEIAKNKDLWNKKVFIVYDCDWMAHYIETGNSISVKHKKSAKLVDDITKLINMTDIKVNFHGLKSHKVDDVNNDNIRIDLLNNKIADQLAKDFANQGMEVNNKKRRRFYK